MLEYKEIYLSLIISFVMSFLIFCFGDGKLNFSSKNIAKVKNKQIITTLISCDTKDWPIVFRWLNLSCIVIKYI